MRASPSTEPDIRHPLDKCDLSNGLVSCEAWAPCQVVVRTQVMVRKDPRVSATIRFRVEVKLGLGLGLGSESIETATGLTRRLQLAVHPSSWGKG